MARSDFTPLAPLLARLRIARGFSQGQLAVRAGCTRQYVTQLERGERTNPSRDLTLQLAHALHLHGAERQVFLAAAGHPESEPVPGRVSADVSVLAERLLSSVPFPSVLHDSIWTVRHANRLALRMFSITGHPVQPGLSLLELVFDPEYRRHFPAWESWARYMLAQFKRDSMHARRDAAYHALLANLRLQPDFVRLWRHVDAASDATPIMPIAFTRPPYGTFHLNVVRMQFVNTPGLWGVAFMPADAAAQRLIRDAR